MSVVKLATLSVLFVASLVPTGCRDAGSLDRASDDIFLTIQDKRISESSGIAVSVKHEGVLYTHNDAGHEPLVFALGSQGQTLATFDLSGAPAADWEDIAVTSDGRVWVGDIGGNPDGRSSVSVVTFVEPDELQDGEPQWTAFELAYPDGAHNAEALLVRPHSFRLYVVTKERAGTAGVYVAPRGLAAVGTNDLERLRFQVPPSITAGGFAPDGSGRLAMRNYKRAYLYERLRDEPRPVELPSMAKGESLALLPDGDLLIGSEGQGSDVLRMPAKWEE
jgi:hypothetical protein